MLILTPSLTAESPNPGPHGAWDWVLSTDGRQPQQHGSGSLDSLPSDAETVLALPPRAVSWHRITLPRVPASKLRAALEGLLEERLLTDVGDVHFALQPGYQPGQPLWVAVCAKVWLRECLNALEAAQRPATRILPMAWPLHGDAAERHWAHDEAGLAWLSSATADGVQHLPLSALAPVASADGGTTTGPWLAEPAVSVAAEAALGLRVALCTTPQWLLQCAQSGWNLAQLDFALHQRARQGQRLRQAWREWLNGPAWRPARWGLLALLLTHLAGLNALAWQEHQALASKQQLLERSVREAFPSITLVLDAPVQMGREVTRLQQASGQLAHSDLEAMLGALDPGEQDAGVLHPRALDFAQGRGQFTGWSGDPDQLTQLAQQLQVRGWRASADGDGITLQAAGPNRP